ncbi:diphthine--ammonia ligase [Dehalococcoides mccartyi]|uniref:Diphthine--ammonia ligase n=1 Tax=Dehalococcoides mccartyi TaxID=61435 RepID=A0AB38ZBS9_9CHLR|nr:diphthine--ammonia ligase [Dehalococcoides mccartyi]WRO08030.1 diphthine--ammonia ligase [Dehalococcoides mccartyi]
MEKAFVSWSGGKDCSLSLYRALKGGYDVRYLASMFTEGTGRLYPHHFTPELLISQAEAIGIPLEVTWTSGQEYTNNYIKMLKGFREEGITVAVFGDVSVGNPDALEHRMWVERVCQAAGMRVVLPLWDEDRESIIGDLIDSGFETLIVAADNTNLGKGWLGRKLDNELFEELKLLNASSPDGKVGLYHTLTVDGPIFRKKLEIADKKIIYKECGLYDGKPAVAPFWYLELEDCFLVDKPVLIAESAAGLE